MDRVDRLLQRATDRDDYDALTEAEDKLTEVYQWYLRADARFRYLLEQYHRRDELKRLLGEARPVATVVAAEIARLSAEMAAAAIAPAPAPTVAAPAPTVAATAPTVAAPAPTVAAPAPTAAAPAPTVAPPTAPTTLTQLIAAVPNVIQREILDRLNARREEDRVYLTSYEPNASGDRRRAHVQGVFTMLGAVGAGAQRETYQVQFYKHGAKPCPFWCGCQYHKFRSAKDGTVCKHIAFLIVRYARILDPAVFANRTLSAEQHAALCALVARPLRETDPSGRIVARGLADYEVPADRAFAADDVCPICYEELGATPREPLVGCPTCRQALHADCMGVWLVGHDTCVMCRSTEWALYKAAARGAAAAGGSGARA